MRDRLPEAAIANDNGTGFRRLVGPVEALAAALLAPLSVLATWANGQINDTDRYIATVGPLANDPDVQKAIAARVEQVLTEVLADLPRNADDRYDDAADLFRQVALADDFPTFLTVPAYTQFLVAH